MKKEKTIIEIWTISVDEFRERLGIPSDVDVKIGRGDGKCRSDSKITMDGYNTIDIEIVLTKVMNQSNSSNDSD